MVEVKKNETQLFTPHTKPVLSGILPRDGKYLPGDRTAVLTDVECEQCDLK